MGPHLKSTFKCIEVHLVASASLFAEKSAVPVRVSPSEWLMSSRRVGPGDDRTGPNVDSHKQSGPRLILRGSFVYLTVHKLL